jgi:hypothetical protein
VYECFLHGAEVLTYQLLWHAAPRIELIKGRVCFKEFANDVTLSVKRVI